MIKLQVLRYMGILTIMKLSVFAMSALSLLFLFTWVLIYCPVGYIHTSVSKHSDNTPNVHQPQNHADVVEYFEYYEAQLNEDMKKMPAKLNMETKNQNAKINSVKTMKKKKSSSGGNIIPLNGFKDSAFDRLLGQLESMDTEGYEFMAESTNVTIYRRPKGDAGLYQYKLYATIPSATPEEITAVFLDNEYRLVWDDYVTELYPVQLNEKGPDVIYFNIDYPWPLANRDYVYARESRKQTRQGKEYITIVMHSVLNDEVPLIKGVIRVHDYHQSLVMTSSGKHGTKAYIEYYDNPGGSIPSWIINWAAKTGVPAFLKDLQRACVGLKDFLKKTNSTLITAKPY